GQNRPNPRLHLPPLRRQLGGLPTSLTWTVGVWLDGMRPGFWVSWLGSPLGNANLWRCRPFVKENW
ncbi:MAG: hypothetical protein ACR2RE_10480, partial [Geminicoccaceae bacterium]